MNMAGDDDALDVHLHVYDLSRGLAAQLSPVLLGRQIDGIWHTGIVVGGVEFYFGHGVSSAPAGKTRFGTPDQVIHLGRTHMTLPDVRALIADLARTTYTPSAYAILGRMSGASNCNDFCHEVSTLLTGAGIPPHITSLPADVLATPFGAAIAPMLGGLEAVTGGMAEGEGVVAAAADEIEAAAGVAAVADAPAAAAAAAASPAAAAALAAEEAAPTLAAAEAAVGAAAAADPAAARAAFEALVRKEFNAALAAGAASPNEAARVALERAADAVRAKG